MAVSFPNASPSDSNGPRLLSIAHVAHRLGLSRRTIYRMIDRGELPVPVKVGGASRFFADDIDTFIEALRCQRSAI